MVYDIDDNLIWAAPMEGSHYALLWGLDGLEKTFTVKAFKKNSISVDVLCWEEYSYKDFGFNWFDFQEVTIKTMCFFGDVCTKFYDDFYNHPGSPYYGSTSDGYDMPAIFKVLIKTPDGTVINDENLNSNASWFGEGKPLCIEYPDFGDTQEKYYFEIHLAYPDNSYHLVYTSELFSAENQTWVTGDHIGQNVTGAENIFDFVVGNCSAEANTTLVNLPAYLFLPDRLNATLKWNLPLSSGTSDSYYAWDVTINSIVGGNDNELIQIPDKENTTSSIKLSSLFRSEGVRALSLLFP